MPVKTVEWRGGVDGFLRLVDQTRLPTELVYVDAKSIERLWHAIQRLEVRGAPAIGVAAAFGPVIAAQKPAVETRALLARVEKACNYLATSRPTAVNLFWALERMRAEARRNAGLSPAAFRKSLLAEAKALLREDVDMCRRMGRFGATFIKGGMGILTHCNAGALATAGMGTALASVFTARRQKKRIHVFSDETRPLLQGARLTMWELMRERVPCTLLCDNMAAQVMKEGRVHLVVTGADRIAANGDAANKIGTYGVAVLAKYHRIPMVIVAPSSTFDLSIASGREIPIEERGAHEVVEPFGRRTAPAGAHAYCPAFDVTPHELITAIVTERGIIRAPNAARVRAHFRP